MDRALILEHVAGRQLVATVEESVVTGGFGAGVLEALAEAGLDDAGLRAVPVRVIGLPADRFVDHGSAADLRRILRLDVDGLHEQLAEALAQVGARPSAAPVRRPARRSA
jgi:1-deoxy-D-xylulose-5-phosphate synthase